MRVILFSYHYFPDQSAGAKRAEQLVQQIMNTQDNICLWVFCSYPRRYGVKYDYKIKFSETIKVKNNTLKIRRIWVPYFGQGLLSSAFSYLIYFLTTLPQAIFIQPQKLIATSAKLLTTLLATLVKYGSNSKLYIDIRDTFSDNFFYFYRWNKFIVLQPLFLLIENFVFKSSDSINIVSLGFKEAFYGLEETAIAKGITITHYPNGINSITRKNIQNISLNKKKKLSNEKYIVAYLGNLGQGQGLSKFLVNLAKSSEALELMYNNKIEFQIYGLGSEINEINLLLKSSKQDEFINSKKISISDIVKYKGLLNSSEILQVYGQVDCLMLQIALYFSLSMVIPSKIFEYVSTPYPIIYSANGFTRDFINNISGVIQFNQSDPMTFVKAVLSSKGLTINMEDRNSFLDNYNSESILNDYIYSIFKH